MTSRDTHDIQSYEIEKIIARMYEIAVWHAKEQVKFYEELAKEEPLDNQK